MGRADSRDAFVQAAERAFEELQTWCQGHPNYTLLELEEQTLIIRQRLMGQAMSSLVAQREETQRAAGEVRCPACTAPMANKGTRTRTVHGPEGPVKLTRVYYYCASCQEGFSPVAAEVAL